MDYIILIEDSKRYGNPYSDKSFYSTIYGIKSELRVANTYDSFEEAQPKVNELRASCPYKFIYAIPNGG